MIRIHSINEASTLGLRAMLDIEKIPYILDDSNIDSRFNLVHLIIDENHSHKVGSYNTMTVFFGRLNSSVAEDVFGIRDFRAKKQAIVEIEPNLTLLGHDDYRIIRDCADGIISLPCEEIIELSTELNNDIEVILSDRGGNPLIIKKDNVIWCLIDLGHIFYLLISEDYLSEDEIITRLHLFTLWALKWNFGQRIYYVLPKFIRIAIQRKIIEGLNNDLEEKTFKFQTRYPIDISGWVVIKILRSVLINLGYLLISVAKWPLQYKGVFVITHDIEPTKFSYKQGLPYLLERLKENNIYRNNTIDLIGVYTKRYLKENKTVKDEMLNYEILCHGYSHDGRKLSLSLEEMIWRLKEGKKILREILGTEVNGFRSPRLDRNSQLLFAIENSEYKYSSIFPDVDRENFKRWGGGVAINFPFYPIYKLQNSLKKASFLEFPVTSPDCILPLFSGNSIEEMHGLYRRKLNFIERIGGMFISIIHAGCFDKDDICLRENLLKFLNSELQGKSFWRTNLEDLYAWWKQRENLRIEIDNKNITVTNGSNKCIENIGIIYETKSKKMLLSLPKLKPHEFFQIDIRKAERK